MKIESVKPLWWIRLETGGNLAGQNKNVYFVLYMVYIAFLYHSHYTMIIVNLWITKMFLLMFKVKILLLIEKGEGEKEKYSLYIFFPWPLLIWPPASAHNFKCKSYVFFCMEKINLLRIQCSFFIPGKLNEKEMERVFTT